MPVILIANDNLTAGNVYEGIALGLIEGIDLTGYTSGQTVYVAEGGGWSTSLPSGSNSITQVLGIVTKGGSGGKGLVLNPGPAQLPGLQTGYVWVGNASNQPIAVATSSFAENTDLGPLNAFSASTNLFTASADQRLDSIEAQSGSWVTSAITASSVVSMSVTPTPNELKYTKGDGTSVTLPLNISQPDISSLNAFTASIAGTNTFTASAQQSINALNGATASYAISSSVAAVDLGQQNQIDALIAWTGSGAITDITALNNFTASVAGTNAFTQSTDLRLDAIEAESGSWVTSAITASSVQSI
jgi:hypothetical protein